MLNPAAIVSAEAALGDWSANLSDLQVDSGATFNGAATPIVVNALNGSGTVKTGGGITVGIDNGSGSFSGIIENSSDGGSAFSITKGGSGTQTLSGANTYTGGTTLNAVRHPCHNRCHFSRHGSHRPDRCEFDPTLRHHRNDYQ